MLSKIFFKNYNIHHFDELISQAIVKDWGTFIMEERVTPYYGGQLNALTLDKVIRKIIWIFLKWWQKQAGFFLLVLCSYCSA